MSREGVQDSGDVEDIKTRSRDSLGLLSRFANREVGFTIGSNDTSNGDPT